VAQQRHSVPHRAEERGEQRRTSEGGDGESSFLCPAGDKVVSLSGACGRGGVKCGRRSETVGVASRIKGGERALALAVDRVATGQFQTGVSSAGTAELGQAQIKIPKEFPINQMIQTFKL
jgi:hypothetical protein